MKEETETFKLYRVKRKRRRIVNAFIYIHTFHVYLSVSNTSLSSLCFRRKPLKPFFISLCRSRNMAVSWNKSSFCIYNYVLSPSRLFSSRIFISKHVYDETIIVCRNFQLVSPLFSHESLRVICLIIGTEIWVCLKSVDFHRNFSSGVSLF